MDRYKYGYLIVLCLLSFLLPTQIFSQFYYPDFSYTNNLHQSGSSIITNGILHLNSVKEFTSGSTWHTIQQKIDTGFVTSFDFSITKKGGSQQYITVGTKSFYDAGADGFAFVLQNESDSSLGEYGGGIGYSGISNSLAIEFDTWLNPTAFEYSANHIAIHSLGKYPNQYNYFLAGLATTDNIPFLSDGNIHHVIIEYRQNILKIFIDDCTSPVLEYSINLKQTLSLNSSGMCWLGFTGSTGVAYEDHSIFNWYFTQEYDFKDTIIEKPVTVCSNTVLILNAPYGDPPYLWSTGDTTRTIVVLDSGRFVVESRSRICPNRKIVWIQDINRYPYRSIHIYTKALTDPDTIFLCPGDTAKLKSDSGFYDYLWSDRSTNDSLYTTKDGEYYVCAYDTNGCHYISKHVYVKHILTPSPKLSISDTIQLCINDTITITTTSIFDRYLWSTGDTTSTITIDSIGIYWCVVWNNGCIGISDTITVCQHQSKKPIIQRYDDCDSIVLFLLDSNYIDYMWSTKDTTSTITIDSIGFYYVDVVDSNGCIVRSDSIQIEKLQPRYFLISSDSLLCDSSIITISNLSNNDIVCWSTNDSTRSIIINTPNRYWARVTSLVTGCTYYTDTISIYSQHSSIRIQGDSILCSLDSRLTLSIESINCKNFLWSTGDTTQTIIISEPGTYSVSAITNCGIVYDSISISRFQQNQHKIYCVDSAIVADTIVNWYRNGVDTKVQSKIFYPTDSGSYYGIIRYSSGTCIIESYSDSIYWNTIKISIDSIVGKSISDTITITITYEGLHHPNQQWSGTIEFDPTVIWPIDSGLVYMITDSVGLISIENYPLKYDTIFKFNAKLLLGTKQNWSSVKLTNFSSTISCSMVTIVNGLVTENSICFENNRRITLLNYTRILNIIPNPIFFDSKHSMVEYMIVVDSQSTTYSTNTYRFVIYDYMGNIIQSFPIDNPTYDVTEHFQLDTTLLSIGVYLLALESSDSTERYIKLFIIK